jgi:hypothetical protein
MDILSRLAASAVGVAASVKPVVAPLFLPAPRAALDIADAATGLDEHEHAGAPETDAPAAIRQPRAPEPLVPSAVERQIRGSRALLARAQPDLQPVPGAPTETGWPEATAINRQLPLAERAAVARRDGMPASHFEATPSDLPAATENRLLADPPPPRERSTHAPVGTVPLPSLQVSMPASPVPVAVPDATAAMFNRLRSLRDSGATPKSRRDPVVRVTIGRIEVRSAPATAPEPVPAPVRTSPAPTPPPRITLAEYLSRTREAR